MLNNFQYKMKNTNKGTIHLEIAQPSIYTKRKKGEKKIKHNNVRK